MSRAKDLLYGFNERPPLRESFFLTLQFIIAPGISLIFPILVLQQLVIPVSPYFAASFISMVMIASAITTFLQAGHFFGPIGSRMFLPISATPIYLAPAIMAVKLGGLPMVFGMSIISGVIQAIMALFVGKIKKLFPPEIAALILILIAIDLFNLGLRQYTNLGETFTIFATHYPFLSTGIKFLPLILILCFNEFGNKVLKLYGIFIAVVISYLIIYLFNLMPHAALYAINNAHWLFLPSLAPGGYHFSISLLIPFMIGAFVCVIKMIGSVSALQSLQNNNWQEPDMQQISRASFTDALGSIFSGLLGGMGLNASSSNIAMSIEYKMTSRYVAYLLALILFIIAFCPKCSLILVYLPKPIIASIFIILGVSLLSGGLKIISNNLVTLQQRLVIGVSFVIGLSNNVYPNIYHNLPSAIQLFTGSSIAVAAICAVIMNLLFMMISHKK